MSTRIEKRQMLLESLQNDAKNGTVDSFTELYLYEAMHPLGHEFALPLMTLLEKDEFAKEYKDGKLFRGWMNICYGDDPTPEKQRHFSDMLMSVARPFPNRATELAKMLLKNGANPCAVTNSEIRPLSGMRLNMFMTDISPFSSAIDNGHREQADCMFIAAQLGMSIAEITTPVAKICIKNGRDKANIEDMISLCPMAFAIACGQTEIFKSMINKVDVKDKKIREHMGDIVSKLLKVGLLEQAPDSVLGDIVTLIGNGAELSSEDLDILKSKRIRFDNGSNIAFQGPWDELSFAGMLVQATSKYSNAEEKHVLKVLEVLVNAGLALDEDVSNRNKGAKLIHYAAKHGSVGVIAKLFDLGASANQKDSKNRSPEEYSIASGNYSARELIKGYKAREFIKSSSPTVAEKVVIAAPGERNNLFNSLKQKHAARA